VNVIKITALSLGERVASGASRVRGYFDISTHRTAFQRPTNPSLVPLRLVKAPAVGHPLPKGEGKGSLHVTTPKGDAGAGAKIQKNHTFSSEPNGAKQ
jgi:hypothetical protein